MKIIHVLLGIAAVFILIGASIWEGSAAIAPRGVLPASGYYAATNSFPRNTMVNVVNLENGKTIQVMVSAGLDNAGVLILLSKDAADAIGIQGLRTGRVRIMEPADPIAFSPFTEGRTTSGDPDYDPNAQIAATPPSSQTVPPPENPLPAASSSEVADVPDDYASPASADTIVAATPDPDAASPDASAPLVSAATPETATPTSSGEDAPAIASAPAVSVMTPVDTAVPAAEHSLDGFDLALVPSENRPPAGKTASLPADAEVPPITPPPAPVAPAEKNPDPAAFVGPIEPPSAPAKTQPAPFNGFSVPELKQFEKGKYYVQLRSYTKPELVESELVKIGKSHTVSVQAADVSGQTWYRIIVGPVSKSDSQTLLQQFKNKGWTDAFVWFGL